MVGSRTSVAGTPSRPTFAATQIGRRCARFRNAMIDCVLEAGDVLYLPRGFIHSAASLDEVSGHLTVGVHPVTRRMIADQILSGLSDEIELRRSLPMGVDLSNEDSLESDVTATIAALHAAIDRFDRTAVARAIGRHFLHRRVPLRFGPSNRSPLRKS